MSLLTARNTIGFTKPPSGPALWFSNDMSVRLYSELVASATVSNSTAESTLASFSIPALALTNQGGLRTHVSGDITAATTATVTLRAKLIISGTTMTVLATSALPLAASTTSRSWNVESVVLGTTNSTQLRSWSYADLSSPSTLTTPPTTFTGAGYATITAPNSSASGTLNITAQFSAASTGISASRHLGTLETLA